MPKKELLRVLVRTETGYCPLFANKENPYQGYSLHSLQYELADVYKILPDLQKAHNFFSLYVVNVSRDPVIIHFQCTYYAGTN